MWGCQTSSSVVGAFWQRIDLLCAFSYLFFFICNFCKGLQGSCFLSVSKMLSRRELYQERLRVANQRFSSTTDYVKVT